MDRGDKGIPRLKYVCVSDIHAGAETSLITHITDRLMIDDKTPSPTTKALRAALGPTLAEFEGDTQPDLVLLGDVLDLSLSQPVRSAQVFETFAKGLLTGGEGDNKPINLSRQVRFLPGNHDHSLWTALRYQTETFQEEEETFGLERGTLQRFKHVTPTFMQPNPQLQAVLLRQIFKSATGLDYDVPVFYPNMGDVSADGKRAVVLHHGHFIENTYRMLSMLVAAFHDRECGPMTAEQLERENGNWIDFGWSTVGENGPIGKDVASVYQFLLTGSEEGRLQNRFANTLSKNMLKALPLPKTDQVKEALDIIAKGIIDATVGKFSQTERLSFTSVLGQDSIKGLKDYLTGAVAADMLDTFAGDQPDQTAFVFGHTHKPFEDQIVAHGFKAPVEVYNTGGWILDTSLLSTKEGAAIIFVDEDMNVASLRAYTSSGAVESDWVHALGAPNPMQKALEAAVARNEGKWQAFRNTVESELKLRQDVILKSTAQADMVTGPDSAEIGY